DDALPDGAAGEAAHQFGGAQRAKARLGGVDTAAEAEAGFGVDFERVHAAADVYKVPGGGFEQHPGGGGRDFALFAAHAAAEAEGACSVGDQDGVFGQLALDAVQGGERFSFVRQARDDFDGAVGRVLVGAAAQEVVVEGVIGLAHL